ncbi:MAG: hypothetical protein VB997_08125, partial [Opitutales bacterium]
VLAGGFGSAVLEFLQANELHIPVTRIGWPDAFVNQADSVTELREANGLGKEAIYQKILAGFKAEDSAEPSLALFE